MKFRDSNIYRLCLPRVRHAPASLFVSLLDPLIQRLQHPRVHCGNDVHCRIKLFLGHPRFPCVRKAPLDSGVAEAHRRHRQTDEHLLAFGEAFDGMRVTIESSEICFLQRHCSCQAKGTTCCAPYNISLGRLHTRDQCVRKPALYVHVIAVGVPGEIIFLHALGEFRGFFFQFQRGFEPVTAGGNTVHPFLIE
jgi:hypothetical protein